jgi:hypothetical protein
MTDTVMRNFVLGTNIKGEEESIQVEFAATVTFTQCRSAYSTILAQSSQSSPIQKCENRINTDSGQQINKIWHLRTLIRITLLPAYISCPSYDRNFVSCACSSCDFKQTNSNNEEKNTTI